MLEFKVSAKEFKKAVRLIMIGRTEFVDKDAADFTIVADELHLCSTGTSTTIRVSTIQAGCARVPLAALKKIKQAVSTFKRPLLLMRIEAGRFRVESFSYSHADIEMRRLGRRIADLPIDAGALDTLAVQQLLSAEEVGEAGLAARVVDAQERAIAAVDSAISCLKEFGISRDEIVSLLEAHITSHAKSIKPSILSK